MKEEFNLSEKIFWIDDAHRKGGIRGYNVKPVISEYQKRNVNPPKYLRGNYKNKGRLLVKDVREFIRRLKEKQKWVTSENGNHLIVDVEEIDKLAGSKLNGN